MWVFQDKQKHVGHPQFCFGQRTWWYTWGVYFGLQLTFFWLSLFFLDLEAIQLGRGSGHLQPATECRNKVGVLGVRELPSIISGHQGCDKALEIILERRGLEWSWQWK